MGLKHNFFHYFRSKNLKPCHIKDRKTMEIKKKNNFLVGFCFFMYLCTQKGLDHLNFEDIPYKMFRIDLFKKNILK